MMITIKRESVSARKFNSFFQNGSVRAVEDGLRHSVKLLIRSEFTWTKFQKQEN